jgi:hypothetical protein
MAVRNVHFPRRSLLFMPGDSMRKMQKAAGWEVDTVILDLEDGVAQNRKVEARLTTAEALRTLDFGGRERLVRLNPINTGLPNEEIEATAPWRPDGYIAPKAEDESDLRSIDRLLELAEQRLGIETGSFRLFAMIETARGVMNLREIARATLRLEGLIFGAEDLAGDVGAQCGGDQPLECGGGEARVHFVVDRRRRPERAQAEAVHRLQREGAVGAGFVQLAAERGLRPLGERRRAHALARLGLADAQHVAAGRMATEVVIEGQHAVHLGPRQVQGARYRLHRLRRHVPEPVLHVVQQRQQRAGAAAMAFDRGGDRAGNVVMVHRRWPRPAIKYACGCIMGKRRAGRGNASLVLARTPLQ